MAPWYLLYFLIFFYLSYKLLNKFIKCKKQDLTPSYLIDKFPRVFILVAFDTQEPAFFPAYSPCMRLVAVEALHILLHMKVVLSDARLIAVALAETVL